MHRFHIQCFIIIFQSYYKLKLKFNFIRYKYCTVNCWPQRVEENGQNSDDSNEVIPNSMVPTRSGASGHAPNDSIAPNLGGASKQALTDLIAPNLGGASGLAPNDSIAPILGGVNGLVSHHLNCPTPDSASSQCLAQLD